MVDLSTSSRYSTCSAVRRSAFACLSCSVCMSCTLCSLSGVRGGRRSRGPCGAQTPGAATSAASPCRISSVAIAWAISVVAPCLLAAATTMRMRVSLGWLFVLPSPGHPVRNREPTRRTVVWSPDLRRSAHHLRVRTEPFTRSTRSLWHDRIDSINSPVRARVCSGAIGARLRPSHLDPRESPHDETTLGSGHPRRRPADLDRRELLVPHRWPADVAQLRRRRHRRRARRHARERHDAHPQLLLLAGLHAHAGHHRRVARGEVPGLPGPAPCPRHAVDPDVHRRPHVRAELGPGLAPDEPDVAEEVAAVPPGRGPV